MGRKKRYTGRRGGDSRRRRAQTDDPEAVGALVEARREELAALPQGVVASVGSSIAEVIPYLGAEGPVDRQELAEDRLLPCRLPSRLASRQRSALAVGDRVRYGHRPPEGGVAPPAALVSGQTSEDAESTEPLWILDVLPRRSELSRPDPHQPRERRLIAANVDTAVVVAALRKPGIKPGLLDRYLIAVGRGGAEPKIVINKLDLVPPGAQNDDPELALLESYRRRGLPVLAVSAATGEGVDQLAAELRGQVCVFVGHSGVGKSSLLNALKPALDLVIGRVRTRDGAGRHTTTQARVFRLGGDTWVIDTPGIRELGLGALDPDELELAFPEIAAVAQQCRFRDCSHSHEPGCAVLEAVASAALEPTRVEAFLRLRGSKERP